MHSGSEQDNRSSLNDVRDSQLPHVPCATDVLFPRHNRLPRGGGGAPISVGKQRARVMPCPARLHAHCPPRVPLSGYCANTNSCYPFSLFPHREWRTGGLARHSATFHPERHGLFRNLDCQSYANAQDQREDTRTAATTFSTLPCIYLHGQGLKCRLICQY